jgi:hypothetical protein
MSQALLKPYPAAGAETVTVMESTPVGRRRRRTLAPQQQTKAQQHNLSTQQSLAVAKHTTAAAAAKQQQQQQSGKDGDISKLPSQVDDAYWIHCQPRQSHPDESITTSVAEGKWMSVGVLSGQQ